MKTCIRKSLSFEGEQQKIEHNGSRKKFSAYISMVWPEEKLMMYNFYDEMNSTNTIDPSSIEEIYKKEEYLEELRSKITLDYDAFYGLEGIGPKTIKVFYDKLGIRNLSDLEKAAAQGKLCGIKGFSKKKEDSILKKIQLFKKVTGRYLLGEVYPLVKQIEERLSSFNGVKKAIAAGSFRRMKETIGDIDFVVAADESQKVSACYLLK